MIVVITGLTGSGKTWFMTRLMLRDWKYGSKIYANFPLKFPTKEDITRWHNLDELYNLNSGVIAIDEGQKLFDARRWSSLPISFAEKIAQHRKHYLDIYTTTQDIGHIDLRVRSNIHELYNCQSIFRWPRNDRVKPILQMIRITKKRRQVSGETDKVVWSVVGRKIHFISRYFTKELYDTYGDIGFEKFICRAKLKNGKWLVKIYQRDLVNQGRKRM